MTVLIRFHSRWSLPLLFAGVAFGFFSLQAAAPPAGTVSSSTGSSVAFIGNATGSGAANGEGDCMDGINCDTFELTISGQPADYVGKVVAIRIDWTVPANDYDM